MKDFDLPILEYCSLERAARFIGSGCEVEDILHWAEIGAINLSYKFKGTEEYSAFVKFFGDMGNIATQIFNTGQLDDYHINLSPFSVIATNDFCECTSVDDVLSVLTRFTDKPKVRARLYGVWELNRYFVDYNRNTPYTRAVLKPYGESVVDALAIIPEEVGFSEKDLLISKNALKKIIGSEPREINIEKKDASKNIIEDDKLSKTVATNRASLIKALLAIHYGEDVANNPRKFIESKDSEICRDFELKGISLPSGKTVASWLQDADIDFN
ncbi:hypothetical protein L383_03285 [Enterobacter sp. MGH 37]|uniref:hypothetical protein n=1 Tax=unclassified Enterobacter cloacae complex TaxID=2757714 RepID=UPI0003BFA683|nr:MULTISPECIES: hypothetical protein [unclassified Enterobacter cloacae complex]ESN10246.1 hypothetical protein L371_04812 [Enterobacter sp. MGH 25]EUM43869.1 hypothetical protein L383_03285 [Enterobacter sp. MGH 37]